MATTLVLGGARSGKSAYAQARAERACAASAQRPIVIVTAQAFDDEMRHRIALHRADRADRWDTVEAPIGLAAAIKTLSPGDVAVIDCLTLWLSNAMASDADIGVVSAELIAAVQSCRAELILVSNEVGWGIVPDNALARAFRDHAGRLHQALSAVCDETVLIVAGNALTLSK